MRINIIGINSSSFSLAITRRLLERVPSDKGSFKPHPKSFSLGHLAQLVSRMPGWLTQMMRETRLDLGGAPPYSLESTDALLATFDRNVQEAAIAGPDFDEALDLASRLAAAADAGRVDLSDLGRRARRLLASTTTSA